MSVILDQEIYKWLLGLDVIKLTTLSQQLPDGRVELEPSVTSYFSTGLIFSRLITKIVKNLSKTSNMSHINLSNLDSIKFTPTPASLTYNWNLIADVLKQLNVNVDPDVKGLIINGDIEMINELLHEIHTVYHPNHNKNSPVRSIGSRKISDSYESSESPNKKPSKKQGISQFKPKNFETDAIDIEKIKANKELGATNSVLEFFLVSLSKHLSLTPKQAVTLLTNGFKYLAHILAKGVKGVFEPVSYWYQEVYAHVSHLVTLIEKDKENNVVLVQQACRPGLLSKNPEVVEWTCRLFSKLAFEFTNRNLMPLAWDWFISEHGGLQGCLMGLKRHPLLADGVISVLIQYARYDIVELFTIHLKNVCPDSTEQIQMMMSLFKPLTESNFTKEEILTSGVLDAWIETVVKHLDQDSDIEVETRSAALSLLCDIWLAHPNKIEEQDHVSATILNSLKKTARDRSKPVVLNTLGLMFKLLEQFAVEKNTYAAVIYKTLTFSVIENYSNTNMREFLIRNFKLLFESNQTIPIGILLEPLFKHVQGDESASLTINVFDIEFFNSMIKHPKFQETHALQLFYILADLYLNNLAFYKESFKMLLDILGEYMKSEQLQEGITRFVKASLAMFYSSEKNKRHKPKLNPSYNGQVVTAKPIPVAEAEAEILRAQKRAMIIQVLKAILGLNNSVVNDKSKTFILYTHIQLKTQLKTEHKGIISLISHFGDPIELITQFENEIKATKSPKAGNNTDRSPDEIGLRESMTEESLLVGKDTDAYSFLRGVGAGVYKFKSPKALKSNPSDSLLRKLKPGPKVEEDLGTIQREYQRKKLRKIEEETADKEKIDKQKQNLKGQLEKRKIELGVASKNQKNVEENIIFEEGSRALEKLLEKKHGLPEIQLIRLEDEEERDKEAVQIFMKKYHKIIHHLFVSYSNVGFSNQDQKTFDKIADRLSTINLSELWKILSDHDCTKYITKEELHALVRLVNIELLDRFELKNLTLQGFKEWFIQISIFMFSRPPKDLSHLPIFICLETLLQIFREATAKKGKSTLLYDNPHSTEVGDKDLHTFLNDALQKDPDYPLPEAYKKIIEKNINFTYELPQKLNIPEPFSVCHVLLDEILNKALGIRLVEPIVNFETIAKAKLKVFDPQKIDYPPDHYLKAVHKEINPRKMAKSETIDTIKKRVLPIEPKQKISLELKKEVANFSYRDRALAQEVAEVLEQVLQDVEDGKTGAESREKQLFKNRVLEAKEKEKEIQAKLEEKSRQKMKQRHEEVKAMLQEQKAKKEETQKPKIEPVEKKKDVFRAKYVAELKEKAREYKEKRVEDKKRKEEDEQQKKKEEKEEKKNQFKTFNAQKVEKYQKKFEEVKEKRDEEDKKKKEKDEEEKKKKTLHEKVLKSIWEKDKEKREKQKEVTNQIKEMVKESSMKKVFDKYEKQLRVVFRHYIDSVHLSLGKEVPPDTLKFQGFAGFASDFNIFPGLISLLEIRLLYNSMTVNKEVIPGVQPSITYDEFLESLMRITIKSKEKLDKIFEIKRKIYDAKNNEAKQSAEDELEKERESTGNQEESPEENNNNQEDVYEEIEGTTKNTLEGLLYYLNLPEDKTELLKKLNFLKETRPKAWREKKNYWKKNLVADNLVENLAGKGLGTSNLNDSEDES